MLGMYASWLFWHAGAVARSVAEATVRHPAQPGLRGAAVADAGRHVSLVPEAGARHPAQAGHVTRITEARARRHPAQAGRGRLRSAAGADARRHVSLVTKTRTEWH